nr:MFS transporter [Paenibacillus oryzisoli]
MIIRSGIGLALAHFANYFVVDLFSFILVRVFQGVMAGFGPASIVLVGTNTPEKHVGYALDVISTSTAAGGIIGPLVGGVLSHWMCLRACFVASGLTMRSVPTSSCLDDEPDITTKRWKYIKSTVDKWLSDLL